MATGDTVLLKIKEHTNMYLGYEWLVFHLHIHLEVYDRNFTLNTL